MHVRKRTFMTVFVVAILAMLAALPMAMAQPEAGGSSGGAMSGGGQSGGAPELGGASGGAMSGGAPGGAVSGGGSGGTTISGGASVSAKAFTGPSASELKNPAPGDWPTYGRTLEMTRYSPLKQINTSNVNQLQLAWSRALGFSAGALEASPVEYNGVLYVGGPDRVLALDATNGNLVWEWKTKLSKTATLNTMRGGVVVYNGNVYANTGDGRVVALNAKTGKQVWSTQVGKIKLSEGFTDEPVFADGKLVVAPSGGDAGGVPGRIIALNPKSGKVAWTFNVIPKPGQKGFDTWKPPSAAKWGGGAAWTPGAYDPKTNTIVWGTGNATPWYSIGVRAGKNLYTASKVGIDASTGKMKWYHQIVPGDEWDYDQHMTPTIATLKIDGKQQRVAINPTSTGFVNIVDLKTGKLLDSHYVYKEETGQAGTVQTGFNADGEGTIKQGARFTLKGQTKTVCPFRWTSFDAAAYSPKTGLYYRPNSLTCYKITAQPLPDDWQPGQSAIGDPASSYVPQGTKYLGNIAAIDPTTGKIAWQVKWPYDEKVGVAATAGGLVFVPSPDRVFRALDAKTGKVLWQQTLPAAMSTGAITYKVNGTQYVAVPAGGSGQAIAQKLPSAPALVHSTGDTLFVFALSNQQGTGASSGGATSGGASSSGAMSGGQSGGQ
jgi:alcohol dehydrogenase (cytochrome c)